MSSGNTKKKVIQSDQINEHTFKYVFEDLSYFTFNFVTFERLYYNKNNQLHREDGPAVVFADGTKFWFLNYKEYSEQDWKAELKRRSKKINVSSSIYLP